MLAFLLLAGGCASSGSSVNLSARLSEPIEISGVPFFPQQQYQCGPAALATILNFSGAATTPNELANAVYLPDRKGSLQLELVAAVRREQRVPYVLDPDFDTLISEIEAGRPVLILQNLSIGAFPRWHYAVVVGLDPSDGSVVLRSGETRRRIMPVRLFLRTWARAENWALVSLAPEQLPARPDRARFIQAAADLEAIGELAAAHSAFSTAHGAWPDDDQALLGLGNTAFRLGMADAAEAYYRDLLAHSPENVVALNNLAELLRTGARYQEAEAAIERALALNEHPDIDAALNETLAEIQQIRNRQFPDRQP